MKKIVNVYINLRFDFVFKNKKCIIIVMRLWRQNKSGILGIPF